MRKSFFYLQMSKSRCEGYGNGNAFEGDAPETSSTPKVEMETTLLSSSSSRGNFLDVDLSPSTSNIRLDSMFRSVGLTSWEDL